MDAMVKHAKQDLDVLEKRLQEAESTVDPTSSSAAMASASYTSSMIAAAAGEGANSIRSFVQPFLFVSLNNYEHLS